MHREEDEAIHSWRIKENLQNQFPQYIHWSDDRWKACLAAGGGVKMKFQHCTDDSGTIVHYRTMLLFRAISSSIFALLDVRSFFILS